MEHLVPNRRLRDEIEAELVEVPLRFYERSLDMPPDWRNVPGGYVLLSESYRADAETALSLGWPTREHLGGHLDIANNPTDTAQAILEFV